MVLLRREHTWTRHPSAEVTLPEITLDTIAVGWTTRQCPDRLVVDRSYDSTPLRMTLVKRRSEPISPARTTTAKPPIRMGVKLRRYRQKGIGERTFVWLDHFCCLVVQQKRLIAPSAGFFIWPLPCSLCRGFLTTFSLFSWLSSLTGNCCGMRYTYPANGLGRFSHFGPPSPKSRTKIIPDPALFLRLISCNFPPGPPKIYWVGIDAENHGSKPEFVRVDPCPFTLPQGDHRNLYLLVPLSLLSDALHLSHHLGGIVALSALVADFGRDVLDDHQVVSPAKVYGNLAFLQNTSATKVATLSGLGLLLTLLHPLTSE